jgi:hypothetical protein
MGFMGSKSTEGKLGNKMILNKISFKILKNIHYKSIHLINQLKQIKRFTVKFKFKTNRIKVL